MMLNFNQFKKSKGFSLLELMIAMVLGLLLVAGAITMFISNKRIYNEQESMSRLQENARFAIDILLKDIRMAGYSGCSSDMSNVVDHVDGARDDDSLLNFSNAVEGSESRANWEPSDSTQTVGATMWPNTDGISVRYLKDLGLDVGTPYMPTTSGALHISTNSGLSQGEVIAVADCDSADIFSISNSNPDSGTLVHNTGANSAGPKNATKDFQKKYLGDASVVKFVSRRYIVGTGASGQPALFRYEYAKDGEDSDGDGNTTEFLYVGQELIEGVENMQLLYGEDTSGDKIADTYVDAANVTSWDNVVAVRLALLIRTINQSFSTDTATYTLLGGTGNGGYTVTSPGDNRRRRIFTTTIQIRNRST